MKPFFSGLAFIFFFAISFSKLYSQNNTSWYFDNDLNKCTKEKAVYVGSGTANGNKFKFSYYNIATNLVKLKGEFTDTTLLIKDGPFIYYDTAGKEEWKGIFINNKEEGYWEAYSAGYLTDSILFENGLDVITIKFIYHRTGKPASRLLIELRKKIREFTGWDPAGRLESAASWVDGDGERKSYNELGKISKIETYQKNKIVSTRYFKNDGTEYTKQELARILAPSPVINPASNMPPSYPGGWAGFNSFFNRNFKTPQSFGRDGFSDQVTVTFFLDKSGYAYDIRITGTTNREVETEIRTVFRRMSPWVMNGHKTYGPINYTLNISPF